MSVSFSNSHSLTAFLILVKLPHILVGCVIWSEPSPWLLPFAALLQAGLGSSVPSVFHSPQTSRPLWANSSHGDEECRPRFNTGTQSLWLKQVMCQSSQPRVGKYALPFVSGIAKSQRKTEYRRSEKFQPISAANFRRLGTIKGFIINQKSQIL